MTTENLLKGPLSGYPKGDEIFVDESTLQNMLTNGFISEVPEVVVVLNKGLALRTLHVSPEDAKFIITTLHQNPPTADEIDVYIASLQNAENGYLRDPYLPKFTTDPITNNFFIPDTNVIGHTFDEIVQNTQIDEETLVETFWVCNQGSTPLLKHLSPILDQLYCHGDSHTFGFSDGDVITNNTSEIHVLLSPKMAATLLFLASPEWTTYALTKYNSSTDSKISKNIVWEYLHNVS